MNVAVPLRECGARGKFELGADLLKIDHLGLFVVFSAQSPGP